MNAVGALAAMAAGVALDTVSPATYATVTLIMPFACALHCAFNYSFFGPMQFAAYVCNTILLIGISMSICLHRYFSHSAFTTSRPVQFLIGVVSTFAYMGGPLNWASLHRTHHKHCDQPNDPHSVTTQGLYHAFVGWSMDPPTLKMGDDYSELNPRHLTPEMLLLEKLHPVPVIAALLAVNHYYDYPTMVWMCLAPMVACRLITYYFNVEFHPDQCIKGTTHDKNTKIKCKSVDKDRLLAQIVGESLHTDHHNHPKRSKRLDMDMPYWLTLSWMRRVGLVWDLK